MLRSVYNSQKTTENNNKEKWSGRIKRSKVKKAVYSLKEETFLNLYLKFQYSVHESQFSYEKNFLFKILKGFPDIS